MSKSNSEQVRTYEDVFTPGTTNSSCMIKIKIIQEMIQIERPKNWSEENIKNIVKNIIDIERHNTVNETQNLKFHKKWDLFLKNNQ